MRPTEEERNLRVIPRAASTARRDADVDGSRTVDFAARLLLRADGAQDVRARNPNRAKKSFEVFDADARDRQDRRARTNELRRILCNLGEEVGDRDSQVESLIKSADGDGNGAIDRDCDEFTKILLAERTTRFAPVSGGGGFLGVSPA